jgi:hypothetical protein
MAADRDWTELYREYLAALERHEQAAAIVANCVHAVGGGREPE